MEPLLRLARTRLARGTAVGVFGLVAQLAVQLLSVPVLTRLWGVPGYGVWVLLFTVPSFLAMADLGLTAAGANVMIGAIARGDTAQAARVYAALRAVTVATGIALLAIATVIVFAVQPAWLGFGGRFAHHEVQWAAILLCGYGFLALVNGVALAAFRAADAFVASGLIFQCIGLAEAACALSLIAGRSLTAVACAFFAVRLVGSAVLSLALRGYAPWVREAGWVTGPGELKPLLRPAFAALLFPAANAVALQGSVVVIGALGGPAAVPAFAVTRTLSRTALQFAVRFSVAAMPRFTVFTAQDDALRAEQLTALNLAVTAALVLPAALLLLAFGLPFIALWTRGTIHPSFVLLALMIVAMIADAAWLPQANLLFAINRHGTFTAFFLIAALAAVALGGALALRWGGEGMALAMLVLELAMIWRVWDRSRQLGMIARGGLRRGMASALRELRSGATTIGDRRT